MQCSEYLCVYVLVIADRPTYVSLMCICGLFVSVCKRLRTRLWACACACACVYMCLCLCFCMCECKCIKVDACMGIYIRQVSSRCRHETCCTPHRASKEEAKESRDPRERKHHADSPRKERWQLGQRSNSTQPSAGNLQEECHWALGSKPPMHSQNIEKA